MIYKLIKGLVRILIVISRTNWISLIRKYDSNSDIILWIPKKKLSYLIGDAFLWDFATLNALIKKGDKYRVFYGNKIGQQSNKVILHTINRGVNQFAFSDYTHVYSHIIPQLERQNNKVYPNSYEVSFWENKGFMHRRFSENMVSEPKTQLLTFEDVLNNKENYQYPFLVKSEHACSANGVFKINNSIELVKLLQTKSFQLENEVVIKQELINMRKDLRVILVGNEVVHYYWRINLGKEWKPTSTSFGSLVDFENFPENWRKHIIETFQKLNITSGAFDVTWHDDNLDTEPLYLEISPGFQPNPKIELKGREYAYYKKSFSPFNTYDNRFVKLIFDIKQKQIDFLSKEDFFK
jgi:glutathione synthase/RimK-type ligase-like ATP-grasp enzyme